jgi:hypothetical protein
MLTTLQGQASDVLHGNPKGATYKETVNDLKDQFGDHHLAVGYRSQLKTRTQDDDEPLQEHVTADSPCLSCTIHGTRSWGIRQCIQQHDKRLKHETEVKFLNFFQLII